MKKMFKIQNFWLFSEHSATINYDDSSTYASTHDESIWNADDDATNDDASNATNDDATNATNATDDASITRI